MEQNLGRLMNGTDPELLYSWRAMIDAWRMALIPVPDIQ